MKILISDREKYATDKSYLKSVAEYYEMIGESQVMRRKERIRKLYNLANGVINPEDYVDIEQEKNLFDPAGVEIEDLGLMFYPIIPNLVQAVLGEYDKRYTRYIANAVNKENTNEVLEALTDELRTNLIQAAEAKFLAKNPPEQLDEFRGSKTIRDYYLKDYRTTIEQWANHTIKYDSKRFKIKEIQRKLLEQLIVTEMPFIHINYLNGEIDVEWLDEENVFYQLPIKAKDISEANMFGWFEYETLGSILNKYSTLLSDADVERLASWTGDIHDTKFVVNDVKYTGNITKFDESLQNYKMFKRLETQKERRYDDMDTETIRVTHMYMLLPKKLGKLTFKTTDQVFTEIVSEDYKVTIKPVYDGKRKEENLTYGEHIEWFYINELYRVIKMDVHHTPWNYKRNESDEDSIWVYIDKNPIQYSSPGEIYGIRIPVHGGPTTNFYSDPVSKVERSAPWQIMYNYLNNRNQQLLATEVGKFLIINQNLIPQESFDGTWGQNNLLKWFMVAQDNSLAPVDPSLTNMGQNANMVQGGFGQLVDLTKTQEVLEKTQLASMIKQEAYQQWGVTPEYVFGNFSPNQTASSVAQGLQRSQSQVQELYTRIDQIMVRAWETILETEQFIASSNPIAEISYLSDEGIRTVFKAKTDNFLLHKMGVFVESSEEDIDVLERIRQLATLNNTLGADTLELATLMASKSTPELMTRLKEIQAEKQFQLQQREQTQAQQVQAQISNQQQLAQQAIEWDKEKFYAELDNSILEARIKAMGYANDDAANIAEQIIKMEKLSIERDKIASNEAYREQIDNLKRETLDSKQLESEETRNLKEKIEMAKLALQNKDIEARNKRSEAIGKK